ncbi:MAG: hypothetical protein KDD15_30475, partial [Lewinella sp.]|nr:hypothetical protein [Lewinella sp.]
TFEERFFAILNELPNEVEERKQAISQKLARLNTILPKLDHFYARLYYNSLKSFADHVAHASGGVMGWLSVGFEEYKVIDLPMIKPIE